MRLASKGQLGTRNSVELAELLGVKAVQELYHAPLPSSIKEWLKQQKKIIFLDFDDTITDFHTQGYFNAFQNTLWFSMERQQNLVTTLAALNSQGIPLFIITRGIETDVPGGAKNQRELGRERNYWPRDYQ